METENRYGWWAIVAWNSQASYGCGTEAEASAYCDYLNRERDINLYGAHYIGATDEEAEADSGVKGIAECGMDLEQELLELRDEGLLDD